MSRPSFTVIQGKGLPTVPGRGNGRSWMLIQPTSVCPYPSRRSIPHICQRVITSGGIGAADVTPSRSFSMPVFSSTDRNAASQATR